MVLQCLKCLLSVKTRIQAGSEKGKGKDVSISALLVKILREEGVAGYFKGFGASMLNTFSMRAFTYPFESFVEE